MALPEEKLRCVSVYRDGLLSKSCWWMSMMVIIIIIIIIIIEPRVMKLNMIKPIFFIRERFLDREMQLVILKMPLILPSCSSLPHSYVNKKCVPLILTNICITFISGERRRFLISFFPVCCRYPRRKKISDIQRRKLCIWFYLILILGSD